MRGKGRFVETAVRADRGAQHPQVPADPHHRPHPVSQYNVGAQTRRTANVAWHPEDILEIHPHDAEVRGINDGDEVTLASRVGPTTLRAQIVRPDAGRASSTPRSTTR